MTAVALIGLIAVAAAAWLGWCFARAQRRMPRPGETAPEFELPDQYGVVRAASEFRGRWLALYFYPRDETPGCTRQALCFRDVHGELEARGVTVCGVSMDGIERHAKFARRHDLPFVLLADPRGETVARYGSLLHFGPLRLALRNLFVIDPAGRIAAVRRNVRPAASADEVLRIVVGEGARPTE